MNFLAEVLSCAEKFELSTINKNVPILQQSIEKLESEVVCYTESVYIKYSGRPKQNKTYLNKAREIEEEMKALKKNADNLIKKDFTKADVQLEKHILSLDAIDFKLNIVSKLCDFNETLIHFTTLLGCNRYLDCMKQICELENRIQEISENEFVNILNELSQTVVENKSTLLRDLSYVFAEHVIEKKKEQTIILEIKRDLTDLEEALMALFYHKSGTYCLYKFVNSLWNNYFIPIVDNTVKIEISNTESFNILMITCIDSKKSNYRTVFFNLQVLLEFLKSNFNIQLNENMTTLKYIGEDIGDKLSELIVKHCLQDTIPSTAEELKNYKVVIEQTEKLEEILRQCKIFTEDTSSILNYANNIDILFINKKCQEYNSTAEWIMKKDLYDMKEIGTPYDPTKPMDLAINQLPHCSVSKSAIELMEFLEKIMKQATTASDVCARRLFCTVRNIIIKYGHFVPEHHSKLLQTIPQQVALFYNNCFYICYELTAWNQTYSLKLSSKLDSSCCGFKKKEIHQLQLIAEGHFDNCVKGQINQIKEIMSESGLAGPLLDNLEIKTEKCIRQCLRQQEILKTVWHKVLSYHIYNKTIGSIMDCFCNCIIVSITKFEDISSKTAEQLVDIIKLVLNRGPKLFSDPREVSLYVRSWYKLNELNFVLAASLVDINDRWADGKGPLALQFKAVELRSLVRALFQNTDRRAAVLARILD